MTTIKIATEGGIEHVIAELFQIKGFDTWFGMHESFGWKYYGELSYTVSELSTGMALVHKIESKELAVTLAALKLYANNDIQPLKKTIENEKLTLRLYGIEFPLNKIKSL